MISTFLHHGIYHVEAHMYTAFSAMTRQVQSDFAELELNVPVDDVDLYYSRRYCVPAAAMHVLSDDEKSRLEAAYFTDMHTHVAAQHESEKKHRGWAVQLVRTLLPKPGQSAYPAMKRGNTI